MHHLQPIQSGAGNHPAMVAMLPLLRSQNADLPKVSAPQQLLFPAITRSLCDEIGLNWWAALKLAEDGWLSFSPENAAHLDEAQEAELRFVGSLVVAGCDGNMLASLLKGLPKPYAYYWSRLYYDWPSRQWRVLPDPMANPEATFTDWLDALVEKNDAGSLRGILELTHDALSRLRLQSGQQELRARV
jgi:hypothetical protein